MHTFAKYIFLVCLILYAVSLFLVHRLPEKREILPELYADPVQGPTAEPQFTVQKDGVTYTVTPLFTYKHYGLVVTQHDSKSFIDISHKDWKDYLNIKDISTIWGYNLEKGDYPKVRFWHGDWTGYYRYSGNLNFSGNCFANSHLLAGDPVVAKKIMRTRIGDQVYLKGLLVKYEHGGGFSRTSSIVRTDTGNGACETIWVTDYRIIRQGNPGWRELQRIALFAGLASLLYCIAAFTAAALKPPLS